MGSRGGSLPNESLEVASLMSAAAEIENQAAALDYADLAPFRARLPCRRLSRRHPEPAGRRPIDILDTHRVNQAA